MRLEISRAVIDGIRAAANDARPREACGLLFGEPDRVTSWQGAANVAERPETMFEIDPVALFAALRAERDGGPTLAGYWHAHPDGNAMPSRTDAAMAVPDGKLWLVVGTDITAWRAVEAGSWAGRFDPLAIRISDTDRADQSG